MGDASDERTELQTCTLQALAWTFVVIVTSYSRLCSSIQIDLAKAGSNDLLRKAVWEGKSCVTTH